MKLSTAALVAGFLATSNAFLIPPNLDEIKEGFKDARFKGPPKHFKDLIHSFLEETVTIVDLECPGCPFALARSEETDDSTGIESVIWEHDVENVIRLSFDTLNGGLHVNNVPLLPEDVIGQRPVPLMANQIKSNTEDEEQSANLRLSYVASFLPTIPSPHEDEISLIPVELTILKMNEIPVKVDTIVVKMIKTPKDGYIIVQTEQIPFDETPGAETCEGTRPWSMCRVKAIAMDGLRRAMHATKEKANKVHDWVKEKTSSCGKKFGLMGRPHPHADHPHEHRPHPHHGEKHHRPHHDGKLPCPDHKMKHHGFHHRFHRVSHMIRQTLRFFVVPALLGIIGGLAASAIGMMVGQAIVFLWFRTYRNGERGPLRIYEREIALVEEEQNNLLGEKAETLPVYEDAPAYEQTLSHGVGTNAVNQENEKQ